MIRILTFVSFVLLSTTTIADVVEFKGKQCMYSPDKKPNYNGVSYGYTMKEGDDLHVYLEKKALDKRLGVQLSITQNGAVVANEYAVLDIKMSDLRKNKVTFRKLNTEYSSMYYSLDIDNDINTLTYYTPHTSFECSK